MREIQLLKIQSTSFKDPATGVAHKAGKNPFLDKMLYFCQNGCKLVQTYGLNAPFPELIVIFSAFKQNFKCVFHSLKFPVIVVWLFVSVGDDG